VASLKGIWKQPRSLAGRYLLAVAGILAALLLQGLLQAVLPKAIDFPYAMFYLLAMFVVAWFGGFGPGVFACAITMVGLPLAVAPGFHWPHVDLTRLIILSAVSLLVSGVAQGQRRARETLRESNEQLDRRVQSRTEELAKVVRDLESEVAQHRTTEGKLKTQLERLSLLDQITRAIGERLDLHSIFQVVIRTLEESLPIDFGSICLYDAAAAELTVTCVGVRSEALALELAMAENAHIPIDENGLSRCVGGHLVYEADLSQIDFPFPQRLSRGGLGAAVFAPLLVESQVFGVLVAARRATHSFESSDCEFLRQLSEHIALAAHQAQIYTALRQAYEDLRQTQLTVMQQERLRALGQMASGIAHDINNAVSPVALYTEVLLESEPNLSPRTRQYLETTQRAIEDVAHTVARMREFYRQPEKEVLLMPVDLGVLAQQVLDHTRARWSDMPQQRGIVIELHTELAATLPMISGIESEIREALVNLVFNAVDAMPQGGALTIRTKATSPDYAQVEVVDSGIGMDEATRRRCLEPFFTTKGERGTGLGLAMVYGIARRHNADVEIDSAPGKGTAMRLIFPVAKEEMAHSNRVAPAGKPQRIRILVVDDDPLLIKSLRDTLESDGHTVETAHGGQEGIDICRKAVAQGNPHHVVITDLGMPYVDGRKVAKAVKAESASIPVILLTGWGQRLVSDGDVPEEVDRVLSKPPKLRDLRAALADLAPDNISVSRKTDVAQAL
jgi:signal transduction histidine kinase/ActR/RegA family two-component response regulator